MKWKKDDRGLGKVAVWRGTTLRLSKSTSMYVVWSGQREIATGRTMGEMEMALAAYLKEVVEGRKVL